MKYAPPSGSAVSVVPASEARICWVRRAIVAARSVGECECLVEGVRVQRLRAACDRREGLDSHPHDVVLGLLRRQRRTSGLRVEAQRLCAGARGAKAVAHDLGPQLSRGAELRDLLEEVVVGVEEEREPFSEVVG
jgi:hypothetical protein